MFNSKNRPLWIACILATLIAATSWVTVAQQARQAQPSAVAVVNVVQVMEQSEERKAIESELTREAEEIQAQFEERQAALNAERNELEQLLEPNTPDFNRRQDELLRKAFILRAEQEHQIQRLTRSRVLRVQDLHRRVMDRVAQYAQDNGFDLVLHHEGPMQLAVERTEQGLNFSHRQRVVYAAAGTDITDAVVTVLNTEFANQP